MLAALITLPHFSISPAISLPKSAGKSASTSPPRSASQSAGALKGGGGLLEIPQVRGGLLLAGRHQVAVDADEIAFLLEEHIVVLGAAIGLGPERLLLAIVVADDRPGPRIGVIDGGDLVVQAVAVGVVEVDALLDDGLIVGMQRQAAGVEGARALEAARLDLERAKAAGGVAVDPAADRVALEAR